MRKSLIFGAVALLSVSLWSCSNNDDDLTLKSVPEAVKTSMKQKYPNARNTEWKKRGTYIVSEFALDNVKDAKAWFRPDGEWYMTESDILFEELPVAVKEAFNVSTYATWTVDDVDKIERRNLELIYVLELENGKQEVELYFNEAGIIVKTVVDTDDDDGDYEGFLPSTIDPAIEKFIETQYPNAKIVDIENERTNIEVDIVHNNKAKEVLFSKDFQWMQTSWELRASEVPQNVKNTIDQTYSDYQIDDIDYIEIATGNYYLFELEKTGSKDLHIKISEEGKILN